MNIAIWKFELKDKQYQTIGMPPNSKALTAQIQNGKLFLWALCDKDAQIDLDYLDYTVLVAGTGSVIDSEEIAKPHYVATVQVLQGTYPIALHVFIGEGA